jgi:hypothetical protein
MPLNAKQRAEYLDILKAHGGEKAYHAGLDMLQRVDSGKSLPKPKVAKGAKQTGAADAKKFGLGNVIGPGFCGFQCLMQHNPKKDPIGFAACVLQCIQSSKGGGTGSGGGTGGGGGTTGGGTTGGGSK